MPDLANGVVWYFVFIFSTVMHEAAHSFAALKLGDDTAFQGGQATLDPIPHIKREPFGMVVVPLLSFFMGGWMFGWASAPYDPTWAQTYPKRAAWMAFAGPLSNLMLVLIAAILIRIGLSLEIFYAPPSINFSHITAASQPGLTAVAAKVLSIFFSLNLILFLFNLLPLPPLDGSGAVQLLMDNESALKFMDFIRQPAFGFIGIILAWNLFDLIFDPIHLLSINLLYPGLGYH
jgi:Zn-dependent protease